MKEITDEFMMQMLTDSKPYTIAILKEGPNANSADAQQIVWEHGRRNFALRAEGLLRIVCPVMDGTNINGIAIFTTSIEKTREILDADPGIQQGIFIYDLHPTRSFSGDSL